MPSTPRKARAAIAAGGAAQALAARMTTMQADAGLTIAMRMPILMQGVLGDRRGQREAAKAGGCRWNPDIKKWVFACHGPPPGFVVRRLLDQPAAATAAAA
jgi:hypothetical protein